jgi:hypothetical protein
MAKQNRKGSCNNPLTENQAEAAWRTYCLEVAAMIPLFIENMGLPVPKEPERRDAVGELGYMPGDGAVRRALRLDLGLHDVIWKAVERDFFKYARLARIDRDHVGGWLNRATQRKTWKLATSRAKSLFREIQPHANAGNVIEHIADSGPLPDELLSDMEFRRRFDSVVAALPIEDIQLLDAKAQGNGYADLALVRGKTAGALKAEACRLCASIRKQLLDSEVGSPQTDPKAA